MAVCPVSGRLGGLEVTVSLHADLLRQARHLARKEPRRPRQASLRRSVSACYYALFHLLVDKAVRRMVRGGDREPLRNCLRRAFAHGDMRHVALQFAQGKVADKLAPGLNGQAIPPEISGVAQTFADLQQHRHDADYDLARGFTRVEVLGLVDRVDLAFAKWKKVRRSVVADTFLVGLLCLRSMRS